MRTLMRKSIESVGYMVFESTNALQLNVALCTRQITTAPQILLVVATSLVEGQNERIAESVRSVSQRRAAACLPAPRVVLTIEFGALDDAHRFDFPPYLSAAVLEKPFDLAILEGIASHCRMSPAVSGLESSGARAGPTVQRGDHDRKGRLED
jgi:hypothetical protein